MPPPAPLDDHKLLEHARTLMISAERLGSLDCQEVAGAFLDGHLTDLAEAWSSTLIERHEIRKQLVGGVEDLDLYVYAKLELAPPATAQPTGALGLGRRAFERRWARHLSQLQAPPTVWFDRHGAELVEQEAEDEITSARIRAVNTSRQLRLLESPDHKRRWARLTMRTTVSTPLRPKRSRDLSERLKQRTSNQSR